MSRRRCPHNDLICPLRLVIVEETPAMQVRRISR
jgi:hypothetical protein